MSGGFMGQRGGFTHWQYLPLSGGTVVGAVTFSAAVTLSSTLAVTGAMTLESTLVQTKDTIGTGATAGYTLRNTIDAAAGAQQYSPMFVLTGEGWKTDATAASQIWDWAQQNRPVEGAAASTSALHWLSQVAGGGYTSRANLSSAGAFTASGALAAGAATPGPYLYVKGPTDVTSYARVDDSTGNVQTIFGANGTEGFAGTLSNHPFIFRTNNTARLTFAAAGAATFSKDAIGTGATAGNTLTNTTAAAAGAQQYSPMFVLTGAGWKTDATAATQVWDWAIQNRPVEGAAASTSALHFLSQVDGGGYTSRASIRSDGRFDVSATGIAFYASAGQIRSDVSGTAFNALNGGMYVSAAVGYDAGNAAVLKIGPTNATGVQVGKSGGTVGLYAATPVARAATIADADGTLADITTKFNTLLVACENIGILLTA